MRKTLGRARISTRPRIGYNRCSITREQTSLFISSYSVRTLALSYHPLLRPLFSPPSHRRAEWILGFRFGAFWSLLYALDYRLFTVPYALLPLMLLIKGITKVLPYTWIARQHRRHARLPQPGITKVLPYAWIARAATVRSISRIAGIVGLIWFIPGLVG